MAARARSDVVVIGAGVSGLTSAVCLAESGRRVRVVAARPPRETTSAAAGASWGPYLVRDPRVMRWSMATLATLEAIAKNDPGAGVRLTDGLEAATEFVEPPHWATTVSGFRLCTSGELPTGYIAGWRYTIPIVDMPTYLGYLERRLADAGTHVEIVTVSAFAELDAIAPVVVNCAGMGAAALVPDPELRPTRGQLVVVDNPGIECFFQEHDEAEKLTYIFPQGDHLVLGGTASPGEGRAGHDPEVAADILARCTRIEPMLAGVRVREHRVGVRPSREHVRVEWGGYPEQRVFHNYGHGGSGVTLSWGCAQEVVARIAALDDHPGGGPSR